MHVYDRHIKQLAQTCPVEYERYLSGGGTGTHWESFMHEAMRVMFEGGIQQTAENRYNENEPLKTARVVGKLLPAFMVGAVLFNFPLSDVLLQAAIGMAGFKATYDSLRARGLARSAFHIVQNEIAKRIEVKPTRLETLRPDHRDHVETRIEALYADYLKKANAEVKRPAARPVSGQALKPVQSARPSAGQHVAARQRKVTAG